MSNPEIQVQKHAPPEWPGKLSRIDAIRIIEKVTDKDDPAWEWAVEDWYDEDTDTMPSIYEVLAAIGVTEEEYKEATGAQNVGSWSDACDELAITTQVRIDVLESLLYAAYNNSGSSMTYSNWERSLIEEADK